MMIESTLRLSLKAVLTPVCLVILLMTVSVFWLWMRGDGRGVRIALSGSLIGLVLVSTGWLPYHALYTLEHQYKVVETVNPDIHWVVVLGGGQYEYTQGFANHVLKNPSMIRLLEGVRLYRQLPHAKLLLSGGSQLGHKDTEASRMAEIVSWFGISKSEVILENQSKNTMDEAIFIKPIVKRAPFYLVTSASHMKRAIALCKLQGLKPLPAPSNYTYQEEEGEFYKALVPNADNLVHSSAVFYETLGYMWSRLIQCFNRR